MRFVILQPSERSARSIAAIPAGLLLLIAGFVLGGCSLFTDNDTTAPSPPTQLSASSLEGAVELQWTAPNAEDVEGYKLYRATQQLESISDKSPVNETSPITKTSYTDNNIENGTAYHYVVTAVDDAGNESDPSNSVQKTPFSAPPDRP